MKFLIAIHHPDGYDGSQEDAAMHEAIDGLNDEMVAAGVRSFVGGLHPVETAKSLRLDPDGPAVSDGPVMPGDLHVGGFWVLDVADEAKALEWGRKAAVACRAPVEVRAFH